MRRKFLIIACLSLFAMNLKAQEKEAAPAGGSSQAVYGEFLGNGLIFSAHYDFLFKGDKGLGAHVGLGFAGVGGVSVFTAPVGLFLLSGKAPHYLEVGIGATYAAGTVNFGFGDKETGDGVFFVPTIGYRYAQLGKGFIGRVYIGPIISSGTVGFPWGGVSVGYKFK